MRESIGQYKVFTFFDQGYYQRIVVPSYSNLKVYTRPSYYDGKILRIDYIFEVKNDDDGIDVHYVPLDIYNKIIEWLGLENQEK